MLLQLWQMEPMHDGRDCSLLQSEPCCTARPCHTQYPRQGAVMTSWQLDGVQGEGVAGWDAGAGAEPPQFALLPVLRRCGHQPAALAPARCSVCPQP